MKPSKMKESSKRGVGTPTIAIFKNKLDSTLGIFKPITVCQFNHIETIRNIVRKILRIEKTFGDHEQPARFGDSRAKTKQTTNEKTKTYEAVQHYSSRWRFVNNKAAKNVEIS